MLIDTDSPTANALVPLTPSSTAVAATAATNLMRPSGVRLRRRTPLRRPTWVPSGVLLWRLAADERSERTPASDCCSASRARSGAASGRARDLSYHALSPSNRTGPLRGIQLMRA